MKYFVALCFLTACSPRSETALVNLENTSDTELHEKAIRIPRSELPFEKQAYVPLLLTAAGDTVPVQLGDRDGDGRWDELFFLIDLAGKQRTTLTVKTTDDSPVYEKRTAVRFGKRDSATSPVTPRHADTLLADQLPLSIGYQPYQTDGPSWENDKVGFRHYLDGRNAKDVFGKKVAYLSPDNVGINADGAVEDNYHVMADWGRDILPVNNSVGLGGIALSVRDSLSRLGVTVADAINNVDTTLFRVVEKGTLRSTLSIQYRNWHVGERTYHVQESPTIWPGMYAYRNDVHVAGIQGDERVLIGLVNIFASKEPEEIFVADKWTVLYTYDKQTYDREWWLGLGLIVPTELYEGLIKAPATGPLATSYFARLKPADTIQYYAVAGWELADPAFRSREGFEEYVVGLAEQLAAEVVVEVRKQ